MSSSGNFENNSRSPSYLKGNFDRSLMINIFSAIKEIRYGSVKIHIQDSKVVQIDKVNKIRMR